MTRVPTLGDSAAEMRGTMARQGSSCGVRVNKESGDIWGLEFFGCTP